MSGDELMDTLRARRKEHWHAYLDSPNRPTEALRQGKFEGYDEALKAVHAALPELIAEAEERGAARVRAEIRSLLSTGARRDGHLSTASMRAIRAALGGDA